MIDQVAKQNQPVDALSKTKSPTLDVGQSEETDAITGDVASYDTDSDSTGFK
jgi:hypothetical protein